MLSAINKIVNIKRLRLLSSTGNDNPLVHHISKLHNDQHTVVLIYIDVANFTNMEYLYGPRLCDQILDVVYNSLKFTATALLGSSVITVSKLGGDDFCVYLRLPPSWNIPQDLSKNCINLKNGVEEDLHAKFKNKTLRQPIVLHMGFSLITPDKGRSTSSKVYTALKEAMSSAKQEIGFNYSEQLTEFKQILRTNTLRTVYQPIFSLEQGSPYAVEALTRGPQESRFQSPLDLFSFAHKTGLLYTLEKTTRENAILSLPPLPKGTKLFLNIDPHVINDPDFTKGFTRKLLQKKGLHPYDIVFEITERTAIQDFNVFRKVLHHYREQGFGVAVDDAGSGYSSLQSIAELKPEFIKLDISLIKDIHQDKVKRTLVGTMLSLAEQIGSKVISEGIEKASELRTLINLGLPYGQGYFLARPAYPPLEISAEALNECNFSHTKNTSTNAGLLLGNIVTPSDSIEPSVTTKKATQFFDDHPAANCLVLVENTKPIGLLMRDKLFRQLSTQYGYSLYWDRPVLQVADEIPLILLSTTPVEEASRITMTRPNNHLYDEIIVVDQHQRYLGNVSIQSLLDTITKLMLANG